MRVLVTRPFPDAERQADALKARGVTPVLAPLLKIEFLPQADLPLGGAQALIATSRNALRALAQHPARDKALSLPLIVVGETTAEEAARQGLGEIIVGEGTAASLVPLIAKTFEPAKGPLLHLAGERLAFDLKGALEKWGFAIEQPVLYRAAAAEVLPLEAADALAEGEIGGAILMSPRTAAIFARLLRKHGLETAVPRLCCYCLSAPVAETLASLGARLCVAPRPREEDVLALVLADAAS
jgi:uroporphyrinogen-III synthase